MTAAADAALAGEHEVEPSPTGRKLGLRREPQEARLAAALGEHAHQLLADPPCAPDRHPVEMLRAHHDRVVVALRRIFHRPLVHVLPHRLVAVDVAPAFLALAAAKHPLLEGALLLELGGAGFDLLGAEVAAAARAAELQHERERAHARALRSVGRALRKVSDRARRHLSVAVEVELALELIAELIEIVPVARRKEIVGRAHHLQDEVSGGAGLAGGQRAMAKHALTVLVDADLLRDLISMHDPHGVPPVSLLWATLRAAETLMYKALRHNVRSTHLSKAP